MIVGHIKSDLNTFEKMKQMLDELIKHDADELKNAPVELYLDTEFNSYKGDFISIALVPESGRPFYESVGCDKPDPWVAKHVMPVIGIDPIPMKELQKRLEKYLSRWKSVLIVADWHEDIAHFCNLLTTGPGERIETPHFELQDST